MRDITILHVDYCTVCGSIVRATRPRSGIDHGAQCVGCCDDKYMVTGNHPILRRPDKGGLSYIEAKGYMQELNYKGYENIQMNLEKKSDKGLH